MDTLSTIEAFTVIGFGGAVVAFIVGELIVTWRRELRRNRCEVCSTDQR